MANHLPYFPFYVNDFAADPVVEAMTAEQVGAYILLLCKAWSLKDPGLLPANDEVLARWARLTPERWSEVKSGVLAAFTVSATDGQLCQKRMRKEYAKLCQSKRSRQEAGRKGGVAKWQRHSIASSNAISQPLASGSSSDSGFCSFSSEENKCAESVEKARAESSPKKGQTWESFLATEWVFYYRGTAAAHRNVDAMAAFFGALAEQGVAYEEMLAGIRDKARSKTQPPWEFEKRFKAPAAAKKGETTAEKIARLSQCSSTSTPNGRHVMQPSSGSVSRRT